MKSSAVFQLENAAWPALLLDGATTICRANPAAIRLFGSALEGGTPLLASIWAAENNISPEQFFPQWERSPSPSLVLKFRTRGGNTVRATASICSFSRDGQKCFLIQLLPEAGADSSGAGVGENSDHALAHQQKLECALQLARTVALDFNNAL
ncbi:MAG TPA: hypothetical protein VL793_15770, partial [Patescibacteria group bacterium]|nr:hypothetical protein [Patescibacteria group bacterium]